MQAEPLIHWPEPIVEYVGFVAQFVALGAVGFRYAAVGHRLGESASGSGSAVASAGDRAFHADAVARAAALGLIGSIVQILLFATKLPQGAARAHTTVGGLLTSDLATALQAGLLLAGVLGLALAAARRTVGWPLAAVGMVLGPLAGIVSGQWLRVVNPVHRVVGGLWLGTLLVLVVAGLAGLLRDARVRDRRGAIAAEMVNGFSPLALSCGMILVLSGVVTAWRHLTPFSSLWTTPYGWTLLVKLALVAVVFALGAWNWRRQRPTLGSEGAAVSIRRSSVKELSAAALVLAASAILVSIPSPRRPGGPGGPAAGAPIAPPP